MTSVMRIFPQIPARIKYFVTIFDISGTILLSSTPFRYNEAITLPSLPPAVISEVEFLQMYPLTLSGNVYVPRVDTGDLLKDLGQQFTITDSNYRYRATYRRVQRVNGLTTEGVGGPQPNNFYVKVWDADITNTNNPIAVVRTG